MARPTTDAPCRPARQLMVDRYIVPDVETLRARRARRDRDRRQRWRWAFGIGFVGAAVIGLLLIASLSDAPPTRPRPQTNTIICNEMTMTAGEFAECVERRVRRLADTLCASLRQRPAHELEPHQWQQLATCQ